MTPFQGIEPATLISGNEPESLRQKRRAALSQFKTLGIPTTRLESWRYTSLKDLSSGSIHAADTNTPASQPSSTKVFEHCLRITFVNGIFSSGLSQLTALPKGVTIESLSKAIERKDSKLEDYVGKLASSPSEALNALNLASFRDGAFVRVSKNVSLETPIEVVWLMNPGPERTAIYPRLVVLAEAGSRLSIVENYFAGQSGSYFSDAVTEVFVGPNAEVEHTKVQQDEGQSIQVTSLFAEVARDGRFFSNFFSMGGNLVRNEVSVKLIEENAECTLNGLFVGDRDQHIDSSTLIDHAAPHTKSEEIYKGILDGKSSGVFQGRIIVRPDAQKIDARQTNKNLILSNDATVDTKPQLEIHANDVKCTHGATVGRLDEEPMFYLRSRGIDEATARRMLTQAFGAEVVERVRNKVIQGKLQQWMNGKFQPTKESR